MFSCYVAAVVACNIGISSICLFKVTPVCMFVCVCIVIELLLLHVAGCRMLIVITEMCLCAKGLN